MIDYTGSENYIIVGDTDDPGTSLADNSQSYLEDGDDYVGADDTAWEAALREASMALRTILTYPLLCHCTYLFRIYSYSL